MQTMLTQDVWNRLAPAAWPLPFLRQGYAPSRRWQMLPIAGLRNFERVLEQFSTWGLSFEDAIALHPSNPRFQTQDYPTVVMPADRCKGFKIILKAAIPQMQFWLLGSGAIAISALNAQGHCVAFAETPVPLAPNPRQPYPEQGFMLDTKTARVIRIDSKVPFVMTRLAFRADYILT